MAQLKPKKKRRSRSDPARREAAARREEARRLAAEERRREQEAAERRQKLRKTLRRVGVPVLVGIGVVVTAIFLFRPQKEIEGVEGRPAVEIVESLGYDLPDNIADQADSLPAPVCGVLDSPDARQIYSNLWNGAVVLFYQSGDAETAAALAGLAGDEVAVAPSDRLTQRVQAVAWDRRKNYGSAADAELVEFISTYRERGKGTEPCPVPGA